VKFGCPILAAFLFLRLGWGSNEPLYSNRRTVLKTRLGYNNKRGRILIRPLSYLSIDRNTQALQLVRPVP